MDIYSHPELFRFFSGYLTNNPVYCAFRLDVSVSGMQVGSDKPLSEDAISWILNRVSQNEGIPDEFHGYLVAAKVDVSAYGIYLGVLEGDRVKFFHIGRLNLDKGTFDSVRPTTYPAAEMGIQGAWVKTSHHHYVPLILIDVPTNGQDVGCFSFRPECHRYDKYFNHLYKRVQDSTLEFSSPDGIYDGILLDIEEITQIPVDKCLSTVCYLQSQGNIVVLVEVYEGVYNIFDAYTNGVVRAASVSFHHDDVVTLHATEPFSIHTIKMGQ